MPGIRDRSEGDRSDYKEVICESLITVVLLMDQDTGLVVIQG